MPVASSAFRPLTVAPAELFSENLAAHTAQEQYYAGRHRVVAWVRLLAFGASIAAVWWLFSRGQLGAAFAVVAGAYLVFLLLVRWHNAVGYQREHFRLLAQLNQEELARLEGKLSGFDPGLRYLDAAHPYAADLDVFGNHSLYQLLNRATSRLGHDWLAGWLLAGSAPAVIGQRQQAVAELAPNVAWQQEWQARAKHYPKQDADPRTFTEWLRQPDFFQGKGWLKGLMLILPPVAVGSVALWLTGYAGPAVLSVVLVLAGLNAVFRVARAEYFLHSSSMRDALRAYRDQLAWFEAQAWTSAHLQQLHATLHASAEHQPASALIGQLSRITGLFSARESPLVAALFNNLLLWDLWCMWGLERWKKRLGGQLNAMLEVGAELEALVSLAGFQAANPTYAVPELSTTPLEVTATGLGHPLIFARQRITNDFSTKGAGQTGVITGSNMSGKSTFLRTVGLNMVLAQAGAAVCARHLRLAPAQVYTAMRTQDNLAESTSSFYAELKRLRLLLELTVTKEQARIDNSLTTDDEQPVTKPAPVFYLLDEILKGTNSLDRHRGAQALIRQLHARAASGLVSTHDLELSAMAEEMPGAVTNYSFNSTIEGDEIRFDYHLTPGPCREFNASKLMQLMGIEVKL
ncbi:MutS-related protein [Hymenobacter cellulosivorans]|uniref:DNA mismatch repair protein MutS n=1 Tax=Hymenobacter cellulosivorans TaxID=2932249 RepID=A0ABY4FB78_9BACT|nr:DNA mismatch repair protein MutS [Hymenobacter cellulosivorans]UOQ53268.1 DNA mismatch repair protein MutS [Hymenobacter cellulosivorans]